ncbi:MAG: hypothetical protein ABIJ09_11195 [Pseudomonadota bacterium]
MSRWTLRLPLLALILVTSWVARAADTAVHGLPMIPWATKVEEDRFRSPRDFADTIKWFDKLFVGNRQVVRRREVNLPGIKYVHYENHSSKSKWSGFNVYQKGARGEVRIFVLKRLDDPDASAKTGDPTTPPAK